MIRVGIADDHSELRLALRLLLGLFPQYEIVCETSNGQETIECAKQIQPDVFVLDIQMPGLDGFNVTKQLMEAGVPTRVLLISIYRGSYIVKKAEAAGALGFVPKDDLTISLLPAIEAVYRGERYFIE